MFSFHVTVGNFLRKFKLNTVLKNLPIRPLIIHITDNLSCRLSYSWTRITITSWVSAQNTLFHKSIKNLGGWAHKGMRSETRRTHAATEQVNPDRCSKTAHNKASHLPKKTTQLKKRRRGALCVCFLAHFHLIKQDPPRFSHQHLNGASEAQTPLIRRLFVCCKNIWRYKVIQK